MTGVLSAILDPLKSAGDVAKGLVEIRDTVKFGNAVIDLQAKIMAAQQGAFAAQARETALIEEINQLKLRVAELESWEAEKQRYHLTDFGDGTFAYLLKQGMEQGEPTHRLCAACFQKRHKSILQFDYKTASRQDKYKCPECGTSYLFGIRQEQSVVSSSRRPGSWMGR